MSERPKVRIDLTRTAVGEALERARMVALRQLRLFEEKAALATFSDREASAFQRVVNSLAAIEREQRVRQSELDTAGLSEADLDMLENAARATLGLAPGATHGDAVDLANQVGTGLAPSAQPTARPLPLPTYVSPQTPGGVRAEREAPTYPKPPKTAR